MSVHGEKFAKAGATAEASVDVDISYDIIKHVSAQLYTNPRKAIEELICNSYDAGADECWVKIPQTKDGSLVVLDNGKSMDINGLKALWKVARSPKEDLGEDRIANNRMQIGKFGVGKLAAFALGHRLSHITCVENVVRVISVGQGEIKESTGGGKPTFEVLRLSLKDSKAMLADYFVDLPVPWEKGWPHWTLALIDEIAEDVARPALKVGYLKRMIASAIPISSKFAVYLEKEIVPKRQINPDEIEAQVNLTDPDIRPKIEETLQEYWRVALELDSIDKVPEDKFKLTVKKINSPDDVSKQVAALIVPGLGPVIGSGIITKTSLTTTKLQERGYTDNGFAITARGKLLNPEDALFGVTQRSHSFWARFLAIVEMPGLDRVLLVQRNAVSENSSEAHIAREVLRVLFNFLRSKAEAVEEADDYVPSAFGSRLRTLSPMLAPLALRGLSGKSGPAQLKSLAIEFASLGESSPAARYDDAGKVILVNEDHPIIASLSNLDKSKPLRHMIGEVLAGTQMAKGYLLARGVSADISGNTVDLLETSLRSAAGFVRDEIEEHIRLINEASFEGGKPFENAVVTAFKSLRLSAQRLGEADQPDGIIEIPVSGAQNMRISVEAKGSKGVITHKELSEATVSRHKEEQGCTNAIAIAREFQTDGKDGKDSALLRETKGSVPLITVAGLEKMLRLHRQRPFTYDKVQTILTTFKKPPELVTFIETVWKEMPELGLMELILKVAHENVEKDSQNYPDPGMILADDRIRKRGLKKDRIIQVLQALQITTGMVILLNDTDYQFQLLAPPKTILEALQKSFEEDGPKK